MEEFAPTSEVQIWTTSTPRITPDVSDTQLTVVLHLASAQKVP